MMTKRMLSSAVLLAVTLGAHAQYNSQIPNLSNYSGIGSYRNLVRTYVPQQGRSDSDAFNIQQNPGKSLVSSNYFDGLGRPVQEISNAVSPHGNVASVHVYDGKGRETVKCLPFLAQDLRLVADPLSRINGIYSTLHNGDHPYGQTLYDNSPLDRTVEQRAPGAAWIGAGRGVKTDYSANAATDNVVRWNPASLGASAGTYDANELLVTTTTDEDGKMVRTFTDGLGRVVCKRSALSLYTQVQYQPWEWAQTYYVYNLLGRLVAVLSPEAVKNNPGSLSLNVVNGLCYTYTYDERGRLTMKRLPGKEPEYYVYDSRDRQVAYQDGKLKASGKWFFTVFDGMDRPLTTGLYTTSNTPEQLSYLMGNGVAYTAYGSGNLLYYLKNTDIQRNPFQPGSAVSGCQLQTLNYYDDYNYSPYSVSGYNTSLDSRLPAPDVYIPAAVEADMPKGLPTINAGREQLPDGTFGAWHTSFSFYDTKNNLIQTQQENVNGITDILTMRYDFNGRLRYRVGQYANSLSATPADQQKVTISESFNLYTNSSLPSIATFRINDGPYMTMGYNIYDQIGRVSNTKLAYDALSGGGFDQVYSYNIRNWLTGINGGHVDDYTPAGVYGPFFSERLNYDKVSLLSPVTPCYNGNIAAMEWKMSGRERKAYSYAYDALNRLIKADYSGTALVGGRPVYHAGDVDRGDYSVSGIGYDLNGNLTGMNQKGQVQNAGHLFDDIDQLKYLYKPSSNQLDHVEDYTPFTSANSNPDFRDNHTGAADYEWDANGNMTIDRNKDITTPINYTYGNKPLTININGGQILYTYDAFGSKLKKTVTGPNSTDTWAYIGPCVYKNGTLEMVMHPEGRAMPKPGGAVTAFNYDYFMKDHLGNVRSVVRTYAYNKLSELQLAEVVNGGGSGVTPPVDPGGSGTTGPGGIGGMVPSPADPNAPVIEYVASMEIASAQTEGLLWDNINTVRDTKPGSTDPADSKAASLYGNEADKRIGTAIMLRVMPGDRFSLSGQSNYDTDQPGALADGVNGQVLANALLSALTKGTVNGSTPVSEVPDNLKLVQEAFTGDQFGQAVDLLQGQVQDPQRPASHLNYVVMNDQMQVLSEQSGALQIKGAGVWAEVSKEGDIVIEQPGYLTVFTSSRAPDVMRWDVIRLTEYRGNSVEENFYYPFGLTLSTVGPNPAEKNNIKLTSKELQGDLGLNWYDFGARMQDMQIGRWLQHDPLAEKIPDLTPYNYVRNNPISRIDINGMSDGDFIDENGKYLGNDGINDGKVYVMKTTQKSFGEEKVPGAGIDPKTIKGAKQFIKENSGNVAAFQNDHTAYNNSIEIPGAESTRAGMVNAMSGDNGKGGEAPGNNREYSVTADGSGNTTALSPGPVGNLQTQSHLEGVNWDPTNVLYFGHSHASGTFDILPERKQGQVFSSSDGQRLSWEQSPSKWDIGHSNNMTNFVFGKANNNVYIYNSAGVQATMPLARFINFKR